MTKLEPTTERELLLFHGLDIKNRTIQFGRPFDIKEEDDLPGSVDDISVGMAIRCIKLLLTINQDPISLIVNSPGGCMYSILSLIDFIKTCPCTIKFYGSGKIMSAAAILMVACDERYVTPNSYILMHDGQSELGVMTPTDEAIEHKLTLRLKENMVSIFTENTVMPKEYWIEIGKRDTIITPDEAVILGMVDEIIQPLPRNEFDKKKMANLCTKRNKKIIEKTVDNIFNRIESAGDCKKIKQIKRKGLENTEINESIRGSFLEELNLAAYKLKK